MQQNLLLPTALKDPIAIVCSKNVNVKLKRHHLLDTENCFILLRFSFSLALSFQYSLHQKYVRRYLVTCSIAFYTLTRKIQQ